MAAGSTSTIRTPTRQVSKIVNLIQIIGEDQVTLKVTVAEVSRNVMKQLGVNMIADGSVQRHQLGRDHREPARARQADWRDTGFDRHLGNRCLSSTRWSRPAS